MWARVRVQGRSTGGARGRACACAGGCLTYQTGPSFRACEAHAAPRLQGTTTPTHYWVHADEASFSADGIEMLTYWLCHLASCSTR